MVKNNSVEEIREAFLQAKKAVIIGHVRPDGDCISSILSLYHYLKKRCGIEADLFAGEYDESLSILPGSGLLKNEAAAEKYDTVFLVDCSSTDRIGAGAEAVSGAGKLVVIDHHISNEGFGDMNYILPEASSACEVLYTLFEKEYLDRDVAACLYTGIIHDSGVFQYSNVSPETLKAAAHLISFGFPFHEIIQKTFYEKAFAEQKALGFALSRAVQARNGDVIWSWISLKEMEELGVTAVGLNGIVENLRNTRGAETAVFLYETEPGEYKVSTRSKSWMNLSELCARFGGGGHVRAAGCSFSGKSPQEIMDILLKAMPERGE